MQNRERINMGNQLIEKCAARIKAFLSNILKLRSHDCSLRH
jgi:hypothetical protein